MQFTVTKIKGRPLEEGTTFTFMIIAMKTYNLFPIWDIPMTRSSLSKGANRQILDWQGLIILLAKKSKFIR